MDDVVAVLAREQRALEQLLFRLHHAREALAADDDRFLGMAADELEAAAHVVRELEAARASAVGSTHDDTLQALADHAPEPYSSLLQEHRQALGRLAGEVGALLEATHSLAADRLAELRGERPGRFRRRRRRPVPADDLDRAVAAASYESVLAASDSLRLPSLVRFLS
ncbi:MAG TPA: hypothetical protein VM262_19125 [Acidimicrobiales bacterium]|nr:hypothetical protein [Acidimicrobiales bacterium]